MSANTRDLGISLLLLRLGVFIVMAMWTLDKFVNPTHSIAVFEKFYSIAGVEQVVMYGIGVIEAALILLFVAGIQKKYTYGTVLILHAVSTLSAFKQYLAPFDGPNLLFFAAWPMLAACIALFLLRDEDRLLTWKASK